jgi:tetratricopeptide (TPR) repeat protein
VRRRRIVPALIWMMVGCSSAPPPAPPADVQMEQAGRAGKAALSLDRPREAVQQFRNALHRAELRDDLGAIADYGYDLAVAQLSDNQPEAALATARMVRAELARRNAAGFPAFALLEATALYRIGSRSEADALAASLEPSSDRQVAASACFLRGLIADDEANAAALEAALRCLGQPATDVGRADALELSARLSLRRGDSAAAETAAERAADVRREGRDYRGMARALALAAAAAQQRGSTAAAASLYVQAGRTAAVQGDNPSARRWLQQALSLAPDAALRAEARSLLSGLEPRR